MSIYTFKESVYKTTHCQEIFHSLSKLHVPFHRHTHSQSCVQCKRRQNWFLPSLHVCDRSRALSEPHDYTSFVWRALRCSMTSEPGRRVVINRFGQSQSQKRRKRIKRHCYNCSAFALKEANRLDTMAIWNHLYPKIHFICIR